MGFKPIVTGATSQRVNRFATATPVGTRYWSPITESNCYLPDVNRTSWPLDEWEINGGARQIQTASLLIANQALYQLSYSPALAIWWARQELHLQALREVSYSHPGPLHCPTRPA